ncbi:hypothetical protein Tco_0776196 [Tanacetum coccineum]
MITSMQKELQKNSQVYKVLRLKTSQERLLLVILGRMRRSLRYKASAGGTMEIVVDLLVTGGISESTRGYAPDLEEAGQLMASGDRAGLTDNIRRRSFVRFVGIGMMLGGDLGGWSRLLRGVWDFALSLVIPWLVAEVLANYEATRVANALESESQSQNGSDDDNGNGGNGNGNHGDRGNNGNENPNENGRDAMPVARVCTYQDFVKCQPLNFKGNKGVVGLTRWFEKMETVFHISNCPEVYQVKNEIQKMETELWNLTVKNNDLAAYTLRFQELTLLCTRMVPGEEDRIERQGHFKKDCPKLKNQNHGNKPVIPKARGKAYAIGRGDANPGSNVVMGTFLLNNHYASVLFDSRVWKTRRGVE